MARKLQYSAGDDLPLYATPEQSVRESKRREEEEKRRRQMKYDQSRHQQGTPVDPRSYRPPPAQHKPQYVSQGSQQGYPPQQQQRMRPPPMQNGHPQYQQQSLPYQQPPPQQQYQQQSLPYQQPPPQQQYQQHPQPPQFQRNTASTTPTSSNSGLNRPEPFNPSPPPVNQGRQTANSLSSAEEDQRDLQMATTLFQNHDTKRNGRLTAEELQHLLQNDDNSHFCMSAIDALINLFGASRFGTINLQEFVSLYKRIKKWRKVYVDNDVNSSFTITISEYHSSLQELGYSIPFEVTEKLFEQFAQFMDNNRELKFDKFCESLVWLMRLTKVFQKHDKNQEGVATILYKDFIDVALYLGRFLPH